MTTEEMIIRLTEHEEEIKSLKHRMNDCELTQSRISELVRNTDRLATNMEVMLKEQERQGYRLDILEREPSEDFKYYRRIIISCICTGTITGILGALFALIIK